MHNITMALEYVRNSNGGASKENFIEDAEPVGEMLWKDLEEKELVEIVDGKLFLTALGKATLEGSE